MKRAIATITIYVYGETQQEQFDEAKKISKEINSSYDCNASVEQLFDAPHGSFGKEIKEINLNKLK